MGHVLGDPCSCVGDQFCEEERREEELPAEQAWPPSDHQVLGEEFLWLVREEKNSATSFREYRRIVQSEDGVLTDPIGREALARVRVSDQGKKNLLLLATLPILVLLPLVLQLPSQTLIPDSDEREGRRSLASQNQEDHR